MVETTAETKMYASHLHVQNTLPQHSPTGATIPLLNISILQRFMVPPPQQLQELCTENALCK